MIRTVIAAAILVGSLAAPATATDYRYYRVQQGSSNQNAALIRLLLLRRLQEQQADSSRTAIVNHLLGIRTADEPVVLPEDPPIVIPPCLPEQPPVEPPVVVPPIEPPPVVSPLPPEGNFVIVEGVLRVADPDPVTIQPATPLPAGTTSGRRYSISDAQLRELLRRAGAR